MSFSLLNCLYNEQKELLENIVSYISDAKSLGNALVSFAGFGRVLNSDTLSQLFNKFLVEKKKRKVKNTEPYNLVYFVDPKGRKQGELKKYYDSGALRAKVLYKDGKKEGKSQVWHQDGYLWLEYSFVDGKEEGERCHYNPEGALLGLETRVKGVRQGPCWIWCETDDGEDTFLEKLCYYKDGKLESESTKWEEDGTIIERCFYKQGKKEGLYIAWSFGVVLVEAIFSEGKFVEYIYKSDDNEEVKAWERFFVEGGLCSGCGQCAC